MLVFSSEFASDSSYSLIQAIAAASWLMALREERCIEGVLIDPSFDLELEGAVAVGRLAVLGVFEATIPRGVGGMRPKEPFIGVEETLERLPMPSRSDKSSLRLEAIDKAAFEFAIACCSWAIDSWVSGKVSRNLAMRLRTVVVYCRCCADN